MDRNIEHSTSVYVEHMLALRAADRSKPAKEIGTPHTSVPEIHFSLFSGSTVIRPFWATGYQLPEVEAQTSRSFDGTVRQRMQGSSGRPLYIRHLSRVPHTLSSCAESKQVDGREVVAYRNSNKKWTLPETRFSASHSTGARQSSATRKTVPKEPTFALDAAKKAIERQLALETVPVYSVLNADRWESILRRFGLAERHAPLISYLRSGFSYHSSFDITRTFIFQNSSSALDNPDTVYNLIQIDMKRYLGPFELDKVSSSIARLKQRDAPGIAVAAYEGFVADLGCYDPAVQARLCRKTPNPTHEQMLEFAARTGYESFNARSFRPPGPAAPANPRRYAGTTPSD
ncbi:hypothetical protein PIIN_03748 [Serendipita indica DSM 11827]|uniref:Uncharacterized protein n=1 Tax=Serendipita indica (strain DSM 11827) TaxID=1109443 RepID=G4TEQ8_SERID|nr:hypothetical protein PIIN_03748 [Serendipita indica DSM 11827]